VSVHTAESLREVAFPLGGIGTGTVSLGGRGDLRDWEIFNHPGKGCVLPYTFFALWARTPGREPLVRVAERRLLPPYVNGRGLPPSRACGLPRLAEATFDGEYPYAWIEFEDDALPVELMLRAWNPMIPLDAAASGIPGAVFEWCVSAYDEPVDLTLALSLCNAAGYDGRARLEGRRHPQFGGNLNEWREADGLRGLRMSTARYPADHPQFGTLALLTDWPDTEHLLRWERGGWWDDLQAFWDGFRAEGRLRGPASPSPSPEGETDIGTLGLRVRLEPRETATLPFFLGWHFPNLTNTWNEQAAVRGRPLGNAYARRHRDAWEAAAHLAGHRATLDAETVAFHRALWVNSLPVEIREAVSSQISTLRTTTCLWTDGAGPAFHAFEGCNDDSGCCPLDCTHVWNYEQALAHLYPDLERSMRRTDFGVNLRPDGGMEFRTLLPLSPEHRWGGPPAADGQLGGMLKLYREWRLSGDDAFLRELWPAAKRSLEYAWTRWDADCDGVLEGEQHNTYDIEFYGPNTMVGTLYLGALRAAARLADHLGEPEFGERCRRLAEQGGRAYAALWNGEYFEQRVLPPTGPSGGLGAGIQSLQADGEVRYQYGAGCLSDQLLGEWWARVVGLGPLLPAERVREALRAIHRLNFRDLGDHASCQRAYALNDEAGLLLCTWPRGGRPRYPFPYADEVWTGVEYQVAAHLIYEGLIGEGLEIVRAARARHDGVRRNPWDEFECGHHYARALSSWSLLTAWSGYDYDAPTGRLAFAPRQPGRFRCFWSTGTAWGEVLRDGDQWELTVVRGELTLRALSLSGAEWNFDPPVGLRAGETWNSAAGV
jgi:non-lysosomal glucosylceramidase